MTTTRAVSCSPGGTRSAGIRILREFISDGRCTIHQATRIRSLAAVWELLERALATDAPQFFAAFEAVLEVLPVSRIWTGIVLEGETGAAADDFEALYNLSRLAYRDEIDEPEQLKLWHDRAM